MYLLWQPASLQTLATAKYAAWIASQANTISSTLELQQLNPTYAEQALTGIIATLRNHLVSHFDLYSTKSHKSPDRNDCTKTYEYIQNNLTACTLQELFCLLQNIKCYDAWYNAAGRTNVTKRMIESLFTDKLTSLSLNVYKFMMFRQPLLTKAHLLGGLTRFHFDFEGLVSCDDSYHVVEEVRDNISNFLKDLRNLKYLTIKYICTNDILKEIAANCKRIEELDLNSSEDINDDSIEILKQLHNLTSINLKGTSVGQHGIETLMLCFNKLNNINVTELSNAKTMISDVLEQIWVSLEKFPKVFKIKSYQSAYDTFDQLSLVAEMCPLVQRLSVRKLMYNILALPGFKNLHELTLQEYEASEVSDVLKEIGPNLTQLQLTKIVNIDFSTLSVIGERCTKLEELSLDSCTFIEKTSTNTEGLRTETFSNLKKLTFDTSFSFDLSFMSYVEEYLRSYTRVRSDVDILTATRIENELRVIQEFAFFLLSNSSNVEFIELSKSPWLTEDLLIQVTDHNELTRLKKFEVICRAGNIFPISKPQPMTSVVLKRFQTNRPLVTKEELTPKIQLSIDQQLYVLQL